MNRRGFLRVLGLAPLGMMVRPAFGRGLAPGDDRLPTTEKEVKKRLAEIERRVGVGRDGDTAICPENGEPYNTITRTPSGGFIKKEGSPAIQYPTEGAAWASWFGAFLAYHSYYRGKIHWRMRPKIFKCYQGGYGASEQAWSPKKLTGYIVSARLVVDYE